MSAANDLHARAGEYVLGLMEGGEAVRMDRDLEHDAGLRAAVAEWRERFSALDAVADRVEPSAALWERISAGTARPAARAAEERRPLREGLWQSLGFWRGSALAAGCASVLLAAGLAAVMTARPPAPVVVAVLEAEDSTPGAIVEAFSDGSVRLRPLTAIDVPSDKTLQVWTLWDRAVGPVPLGMLRDAREARLSRHGQPVPQARQLYEITLEPSGGSPTGRPTGPILYKGLAATPL
jgi:anti-sigma-K factor RskA